MPSLLRNWSLYMYNIVNDEIVIDNRPIETGNPVQVFHGHNAVSAVAAFRC